jgi:signal transduction histidine kinase
VGLRAHGATRFESSGNAVQHGHPKTPVEIITVGDDPAVVTLTVGNQGPAIPREHHFSIFDPLNRGPRASDNGQAGSLGLGLYIAREIAIAHGGSVTLLSSDEVGTFFEARLPRVPTVA